MNLAGTQTPWSALGIAAAAPGSTVQLTFETIIMYRAGQVGTLTDVATIRVQSCEQTYPGSVAVWVPAKPAAARSEALPDSHPSSAADPPPPPAPTGSWACVCPSDTFRRGDGSACEPCGEGSRSQGPDAVRCECQPGYFAGSASGAARLCLPCSPGSISTGVDQQRCQCLPGWVQGSPPVSLPTGARVCVACADGKSTSGLDSESCVCGGGSFTNHATGQCVHCDNSTSRLAATGDRCECLADHFPDPQHLGTCLPCGQGATAPANAQRCSCVPGFFRRIGGGSGGGGGIGPISNTTATACVPCPPGSNSAGQDAAACDICDRGYAHRADPVSGSGSSGGGGGGLTLSKCVICPVGTYAPLDVAGLGICIKCPAGGRCPGGEAFPSAAPGFWIPPSFASQGNGAFNRSVLAALTEPAFLECRHGSSSCLEGGRCAAGYAGPLCAACAPGFGEFGRMCRRCARARDTSAMAVAALFFALAIVYQAWSASRPRTLAVTCFRVAINYAQTLFFIGTLGFAFPLPLLRANQVGSSATGSVRVLSFKCSAGLDFVESTTAYAVLAVTIAVVFLALLAFASLCHFRARGGRRRARRGQLSGHSSGDNSYSLEVGLLQDHGEDDPHGQTSSLGQVYATAVDGEHNDVDVDVDVDVDGDGNGGGVDAPAARKRGAFPRAAVNVMRVLVVVTIFLLPTISAEVLRLLRPCEVIAGAAVLHDDVSVACADAATARILAWAALVLFVVLCPVAIFGMLAVAAGGAGRRGAGAADDNGIGGGGDDIDDCDDDGSGRGGGCGASAPITGAVQALVPDTPAADQWLEPLLYVTRGYAPKWRLWEVAVLSRKLSIIAISTAVVSPAIQAFLASVVLVVALVSHTAASPFDPRPDRGAMLAAVATAPWIVRAHAALVRLLTRLGGPHRLEQGSLLVCLITVLMGPIFSDNADTRAAQALAAGTATGTSGGGGGGGYDFGGGGAGSTGQFLTVVLVGIHIPVVAAIALVLAAIVLGIPAKRAAKK
jgi:hypothetical protein